MLNIQKYIFNTIFKLINQNDTLFYVFTSFVIFNDFSTTTVTIKTKEKKQINK